MLRSALRAVCWITGIAACMEADAACSMTSGSGRVPLVELYTAEGCSECPAADRWLSSLALRPPDQRPVLLALHVDYWDDIGWPDPFAAPLHGRRQEARVLLAGKRVVVTPQVMMGRHVLVDWRDTGAFSRLLAAERFLPPGIDLSLDVTRGQGELRVAIGAHTREASVSSSLLWLALYEDGLSRRVTGGENAGRWLRHDRVVRHLQGPLPVLGDTHASEASVPLPADADIRAMGLVLFAESSLTGEGLQAMELPLSACGPE